MRAEFITTALEGPSSAAVSLLDIPGSSRLEIHSETSTFTFESYPSGGSRLHLGTAHDASAPSAQ